MKSKKAVAAILVGLFIYLSLYTWNLRTGYLDSLASYSGLEFVGLVLKPGKWAADEVSDVWGRYVSLVGVHQENERLTAENQELKLENIKLREQALATARLERLLRFNPPEGWNLTGARVVAHRMGPAAALDTVVIGKGKLHGVNQDDPVLTPVGVVGRVMRTGAATSTVLLLADPNSSVAVIGRTHRSAGILTGQGPGRELKLRYMNLNAEVEPGEILITSGLAGIYPKGLPVARVSHIERSDISLFLTVYAEPLEVAGGLEEVLVLERLPVDPDYAVPEDGGPGLTPETGAAPKDAAPAGDTGQAGQDRPAIAPGPEVTSGAGG